MKELVEQMGVEGKLKKGVGGKIIRCVNDESPLNHEVVLKGPVDILK